MLSHQIQLQWAFPLPLLVGQAITWSFFKVSPSGPPRMLMESVPLCLDVVGKVTKFHQFFVTQHMSWNWWTWMNESQQLKGQHCTIGLWVLPVDRFVGKLGLVTLLSGRYPKLLPPCGRGAPIRCTDRSLRPLTFDVIRCWARKFKTLMARWRYRCRYGQRVAYIYPNW